MKAAQLSGNMANTEFGRQSQIASARDSINNFNAQNRQGVQERNLNARQAQSIMEADAANKAELHNKALLQQDYQNRMAKAKTMAGLESDIGNAAAENALASGKAQAGMYSGIGNAIWTAATGYGASQAKATSAATAPSMRACTMGSSTSSTRARTAGTAWRLMRIQAGAERQERAVVKE